MAASCGLKRRASHAIIVQTRRGLTHIAILRDAGLVNIRGSITLKRGRRLEHGCRPEFGKNGVAGGASALSSCDNCLICTVRKPTNMESRIGEQPDAIYNGL